MKLTQEQIDGYIESNGTHCPFCKSGNITTCEAAEDCGTAHGIQQAVTCCNCNETWYDVYTLSGIMTEDETDAEN